MKKAIPFTLFLLCQILLLHHNILPSKQLSYKERALLCTNPVSKKLFLLMEEKKTNLAVAADVTTKQEL